MPGSEIQVTVRLVDQVSRAAGKVSSAINKLVTGSEKAGKGGEAIARGAAAGATGLDKLGASVARTSKAIAPVATGAQKTAKGITAVGNASAKAATQMGGFGKTLGGVSQNLTGVGIGLTAIGAGLTAAVAGPIKIAADFERAMSAVKAISGATAEEFDMLKQSAMELGATTIFTARQVADAQRFMAMAGLEAAQILGALPAVLDLAAAGNLELGRAADIVTNILTAYNLEVSDLGHAVDVLVATFTSANTTLEELGDAFKFVAPVAAALGVPLEQTAASLGLLANAGLKASLAGTSLRGTLTQLLNPSEKDAAVMAELGLRVNDAAGNFVGFADIVEQFSKSGAKTSQILQILGQRAGPGLQALVSIGAESIRQFEERLKFADGIARQIATTMTDNVYGAAIQLTSAMEGLAITVGDPLLNATRSVLGIITDLVRGFNNFFQALGVAGPVLAVVVGALGVMLTTTGALVVAWSFFGKGLTQVAALFVTLAARITGSMVPALVAETAAVTADAAAQGALATALQAVNIARLGTIAAIAAVAVGIGVLTSAIIESIRRRREELKTLDEARTRLVTLAGSYETAKTELARMKAEGIKATDLTGAGFIKLRDNVEAAKDELLLLQRIKLDELEQALERLEGVGGLEEGLVFDTGEAVEEANRLRREIAELEKQTKEFDETVKKIRLKDAFDPGQALARIDLLVTKLDVAALKANELPEAFVGLGQKIGDELSKILPQFEEDLDKLDKQLREVGKNLEEEISLRKIGKGSEARFKELQKAWTELNNNIKKTTEDRDRFIEGSVQRFTDTTKLALDKVSLTYDDLAKKAEKAFRAIARSSKSTFDDQVSAASNLAGVIGAQYRAIQGEVVGALNGINAALAEVTQLEAGIGKAAGIAQLQQALVAAATAGIEAFTALQSKVESTINAIIAKETQLSAKIKSLSDSIRNIRESAEEARLGIIRENLTQEQKLASFKKEAEQTIKRLRKAARDEDIAGTERYGSKIISIAQQLANFKGQEKNAIKLINEQEKIRLRLLNEQKLEAERQQKQWEALRTSLEKIQEQIATTVTELQKGLEIKLDTETVEAEIARVREKLLEGATLTIDADTQPADQKIQATDAEVQSLTEPKTIPVGADTSHATSALRSVKSLLDSIKSKTVTITTVHRTVQASQEGGPVQKLIQLAFGGRLPGYGGGDRVPVLAEAGEWVIRKEAVRKYGDSLMAAINTMRLPGAPTTVPKGFQEGGPVSRESLEVRFAVGEEQFPLRVRSREDLSVARALARELDRSRLVQN